jgi:hypothetical protein
MPRKTWTLIDHDNGQSVEHLALGPDELGLADCSVTKRTLQAGASRGVEVVEVDNGRLKFTIVPTRGMGIWRADAGDVPLAWKSPVRGPVHPSLVRLWEPSGIGWLDGFDELFVRCGLESNGAPDFNANGSLRYPLHGKIANTPAHKVEVHVDTDQREINVVGVVDEARLFGNNLRLTASVSTQAGDASLTVTDVISNLSSIDSELELLYHINIGSPLLSPGARVLLPAARIVPRDDVAVGNLPEWDQYGPETPGAPEAVFFVDLLADADGMTQAMLRSADGQRGMRLTFNKRQLPRFALWKNRTPAADGYVTGLEPCINYPNPKSFEQSKGRVDAISPGDSRTYAIVLEALTDAAAVQAAEADISRLQGDASPELADEPDPQWSA